MTSILDSLDKFTLKWEQQTILEQHFFYSCVAGQAKTNPTCPPKIVPNMTWLAVHLIASD